MTDRFFARSASDQTDDWPWWFVADRGSGGINRTAEAARIAGFAWKPGAVFLSREGAQLIAATANAKISAG